MGTSISPTEWLAHPGSVGRHDGNGATMQVLDETGGQLRPGDVGMLWIRNPGGVRSSYLGDPDKTAASHRGEYYTVGDLARIDDEGWVYIVDRRIDLVLSGGVNIYPAEVEGTLRAHPAVDDVAVVGAADQEWGQRVHAVVVPAAGYHAVEDLVRSLRHYAERTLPRFKVPRTFEFRHTLPYTPTGKLLRGGLRDEVNLHDSAPKSRRTGDRRMAGASHHIPFGRAGGDRTTGRALCCVDPYRESSGCRLSTGAGSVLQSGRTDAVSTFSGS